MSDVELEEDEPEPVRAGTNAAAFLHLMAMLQERDRAFQGNDELVESLRSRRTLKSPRIIRAMKMIPRGDFVPVNQRDEAYSDSPLPLQKWGFNISAPHMYAMCLEALDPQPGMSFLDIGSGCGHLTALAAELVSPGGHVLGLDIREDVIEFSRQNVATCQAQRGITLECEFENRNCFIPDIEERKFDRIHTGACCPVKMLPRLIALLNPGGVLVSPCGSDLVKINKHFEDEDYDEEVLCSVRYGELILPSKAEEQTAIFENERKRARQIKVPRSTFEKDREVAFARLQSEMEQSVGMGFVAPTQSTDVSLLCGDTVFYGHRAVVGQRADHFGALFHSGMKDSNDKQITIIPTCEPQSFCDFLIHLYTDKEVITSENVVELLELSSFYQAKRLLAQCEVFIKEGIDAENVCQLLEVADRHAALQLKRFCESYIIDHFPKVRTTQGFKTMPQPLLLDITATACHQLTLATATHHKPPE